MRRHTFIHKFREWCEQLEFWSRSCYIQGVVVHVCVCGCARGVYVCFQESSYVIVHGFACVRVGQRGKDKFEYCVVGMWIWIWAPRWLINAKKTCLWVKICRLVGPTV